jgi:hypothetical protein
MAGTPIPRQGYWSEDEFDIFFNADRCLNLTSGPLFYGQGQAESCPASHQHRWPAPYPLSPARSAGYGNPDDFSANTRFEVEETNLLYFIIDEDDKLSFVLTNDRAFNLDGGTMRLRIDAPDLGVANGRDPIGIPLTDDPGTDSDCTAAINDCYQWDPILGDGIFYWTWSECWCAPKHARSRRRSHPAASHSPPPNHFLYHRRLFLLTALLTAARVALGNPLRLAARMAWSWTPCRRPVSVSI